MNRVRRFLVPAVAALLGSPAAAAPPEGVPPFVRVHVPAGRLGDVPIGPDRHVPLPLTEFDAAVRRLRASGNAGNDAPQALADSARYVCAIDERGGLAGTLSFDLGAAAADAAWMPVGALDVAAPTMRTAAGVGEPVVFGLPGDAVAIAVPAPGTYACRFATRPAVAGVWRLPLVPALATIVELELPPELRPLAPRTALVEPPGAGRSTWRIETGPAPDLVIALSAAAAEVPRVTAWNEVIVRGRQASVTATVVPGAAWQGGGLVLRVAAGLRVTAVRTLDDAVREPPGAMLDWRSHPEDGTIEVLLPRTVAGPGPFVVSGIAPVAASGAWRVATVRPNAEGWAGGGTTLVVLPDLAVQSSTLDACVAVADEVAARWPVAPGRGTATAPPPAEVARLHFEDQTPAATVDVTLAPRQPRFDCARVTTVDISPAAVLGRAACDVRVVSGAAFEVVGRVGSGWIVDAVEVVDRAEPAAADGADPAAAVGRSVDWRVVRSPAGNELRIGLAVAATPRRGLELRIAGHRAGIPLGGEFSTADMEMVRLEGENVGAALIDFRAGPETLVEVGAEPVEIVPAEGRLVPLVEAGSSRGRIRGGERVPARRARLVQRRPPLTADVQVRVTPRDERLAESFTFTCEPQTGEIDAVVVHVSTPTAGPIEWTVLQPAGRTVRARRLDPAEGSGPAARPAGVAESWLAEFRPVEPGPLTFRATRSAPFTAPTAVPLAWVAGATSARGVVEIRDGGAVRPGIVNRRLWELPPQAAVTDEAAAVLAEFACGDPRDAAPGADGAPAAELLPAAAPDARAWAWRETTSTWCHASGQTECECDFEIENHGRAVALLTVPPGIRVEEVLVDGMPVPLNAAAVAAGRLPLPLAPTRRHARVVVRGSARAEPRAGWWRVGLESCVIDMPVFDRRLQLMLPPDLQLAWPAQAGAEDAAGWATRLFAAGSAARATSDRTAPATPGFRGIRLPPNGIGPDGTVIVIRRRTLVAAAIGAATAAAVASALFARGRLAGAVLLGVAGAAALLWIEPPFVSVVRAAWWGLIGGTALAAWQPTHRAGAALILLVVGLASGGGAVACAAETAPAEPGGRPETPYRVFITPGADGGTAFVPEPLYRILAARGAAGAGVRVSECRVRPRPGDAPWGIEIDFDADQGAALVLDQTACGARWVAAAETVGAGVTLRVDADPAVARLLVAVPGRHVVRLDVLPAVDRWGDVRTQAVCLPAAARSTIALPGDGALCECAAADGVWRPAGGADAAELDLQRASRVRLVGTVDPRLRIAATVAAAASRNDIDWQADGCAVSAAFEWGGERDVVRSVVVRTDPGVEILGRPSDASGPLVVRPLGAGRVLLERPAPLRGATRIELQCRRNAPGPVGVFDVPGVWLENVVRDARTARLAAGPDLDVTAELPAGLEPLPPRPGAATGGGAAWREEVVAPAPGLRPRVTVRRRPATLRGTQNLAVAFDADQVGLRLQGTVDATATPLRELAVQVPAGCTIDRVEVRPDEGNGPIDVVWTRPAPARLMLAVQRPVTGRFRIAIDARLPIRPASRGRVPLVRLLLGGAAPLVFSWQASPEVEVTVEESARAGARDAGLPEPAAVLEVPPDADGPEYVLALRSTLPPVVEPPRPLVPPAPAADRGEGNRVELADVHLAIDARGRVWGTARFDVVTSVPRLTLSLPDGVRLHACLVDGRETPTTPAAPNAWDLTLHDVRWPRSLLAVFAGDVGSRLADGAPIRIAPPRIVGMPCRDVLWTLETPARLPLRVLDPADETAASWAAVREAAAARIDARLDAVLAEAGPLERARLRSAARRSAAVPPVGLPTAADAAATGAVRRIHVSGPTAITFRAVRPRDDGRGPRTLLTGLLVAVSAAGWWVVRRRRVPRREAGVSAAPQDRAG